MSFGGFNSGGGGGFGSSGGGGFGNSGGSGGSLFGGGNSGGGFGASNTGGGFGASNNSGGGFGASNNSGGGGFGSSNSGSSFGFGGGNNNSGGGFGSSNTGGSFGSSNTGGGFGSSNTGGGFGSSNTGGGFGSNNTGGGFGSTNTGGGFGSNTSFGSPSQPANNSFGSGGGFGSSNTGGGFGSSNAGGGFGSNNTGGGFGSTNTGGGFGSNNTGGGSLFGGSSTSNNSVSFGGFNSTSTSAGGFGSSNATGGFGASNSGGGFNAGSTGTTVEFQPTVDSASSSHEVFMTILAMNQYANKSAEQLRLEDYSAGRRPGSTQGNSGQPASGGFGAPASGGGLFGSNNTNANSGGLFGGGGNSGTSFGASNNNGGGALFGSSGNTNSFGTSSSSGGMFGSSNTSTSGFGSTSTGFGSNTQTNSGGGLFGGGNNTNSSGGGLFGGGGNQNTNTGGGLFGGGGNTNTAGGFGSNQPQSGGLFGSSNSQASSGGLFGGNTANNNTFGNSANNSGGGLFGSTNNNPSGGFGSSNASGGGLFGGSNTGTAGQTNQFGSSGGSLFGGPTATNNTSGGLFGGSNNNAGGGGGLFGSSNNTSASGGGLFGSTNTNTSGGGLFGSSTAAPNTGGGLFGGSAGTSGGGGLFGSSSAAPANGGGGLFGGSGASTGFGSSNTTGGGGLFGSSGNTSNTFGSANTSGGLFGSTTTNNTAGGGLFGNSGTSSFMQSSQPQQQPMQNQMQPNNQLLMQQQMLALTQGEPYAMGPSSQMARHIALANEAWNPEPNSEDKSRDVDDDSDRLGRHSGSVVKSDKTKTPGRGVGSTPIGKVQIRPRGYGRTYGAVASMVGSDAASAPGSSLRSARTVSAAAPSTPGPSNGNVKTATDKAKQDKPGNGVLTPGVFDLNKRLSIKKSNRKNTPLALSSSQNVPAIENVDSEDSHSQYRGGASSSDDENKSYDDSLKTPSRTGGAKSHGKSSSTPLHDEEGVYDTPDRLPLPVDKGNIRSSTVTRSARRKGPLSEHCPRMSEAMMDAGYTTSPSMRDLMGMTDEELKSVSNFRIERDKYGSVQWVGKVDVRDLDIDAVVTIEEMSIEVYPDEDGTPERGTKLNRPAICVLSHVEIPSDFEGAKEDFAQWVKETYQPLLKDTTFISYDVETSDWCFRVEHFTRYAFNTDASTPYPRSARGRRAREVSREEPLTPGLHGRDDEMDRLEVDDDRGSMGEFSSPEDLNGGTTGSNTYDDRFNVDAGHDEFRHQQPGHQAHMLNALPAGLQNVPPLRGFRFNQARPLANQELGRDPIGAFGHGDDDDDDDVDIEGAGLYSVSSIRPEPILFNELNELPIEDGPTFAIFRDAGGDGRLLQGGLGGLDRMQRPPIRKLHRPFRASWGANGRLVFAKGSRVQLMKVNVDDPTPSDGERIRIVMDACKMHVANKRAIQNEEDDDMKRVEHSANRVLATAVDNLLGHAQPSPSFGASSTEVEVKVWSLIKNSWFVGGPCVPDPSIAESVEMTWESWYEALPRRSETAVCNQRRIRDEWLDSHDTWLKEHLTNEAPEYLGDVAGALSLKCIEQASDLAIERGDFRLATLISQAAGDCKVRDLLRRQLELWTENGAISHIDDELVNIYQMLAGNVQEEQRKKPWLRALALNSWYAHDPLANLAQGMGTYQSAFMAGYAPSPRPTWYSQKHDCTNCFDTVYQVLQLACSPNTHPMADVLNPRGYSGNMLTYGMSWTLWHILKSFGVFGGMLSSLQEHQLGMNYILELEAKGSWTWAVAVAMFLPEPAKREEAARALLDRHFSASSETSIFFQELGIPQTWIAYSAAFRQGYSANIGVDAFESRCAEAESYGLAGDLARRCQVIDEHLATPAILNGNTSLLYKMLRPDEESIQHTAVTTRARWACRCLVYLEYACLRERLRNIEEDDIFDFRDSCRKLQMDLIALQSNRTIALHSALAAEIGTWLQLRATEILRSTGTDHSTDPRDYEAALLVPAHETVLRTAVARLTVSFVESF